jgi:prepilin-type N-terminal cleavage/methylation domain-containing protein
VRKRTGYTVIELLTAIVILATLAAFLYPVLAVGKRRAHATSAGQALNQVQAWLHLNLPSEEDELVNFWETRLPTSRIIKGVLIVQGYQEPLRRIAVDNPAILYPLSADQVNAAIPQAELPGFTYPAVYLSPLLYIRYDELSTGEWQTFRDHANFFILRNPEDPGWTRRYLGYIISYHDRAHDLYVSRAVVGTTHRDLVYSDLWHFTEEYRKYLELTQPDRNGAYFTPVFSTQ